MRDRRKTRDRRKQVIKARGSQDFTLNKNSSAEDDLAPTLHTVAVGTN